MKIKQCPKCIIETTSWDPAQGGSVTAQPCGHRLSFKEAMLAFPKEMAQIMDDLDEGYCP